MRTFYRVVCFAGLLIILGGCAVTPRTDAVTQGSLINALMAGQYDGTFSPKDVASWGDLGIGTFDHLDGEMSIVDGVTYQANAAGQIRTVSQYLTPFVTVKHFVPDKTFALGGPLDFDGRKAKKRERIF